VPDGLVNLKRKKVSIKNEILTWLLFVECSDGSKKEKVSIKNEILTYLLSVECPDGSKKEKVSIKNEILTWLLSVGCPDGSMNLKNRKGKYSGKTFKKSKKSKRKV